MGSLLLGGKGGGPFPPFVSVMHKNCSTKLCFLIVLTIRLSVLTLGKRDGVAAQKGAFLLLVEDRGGEGSYPLPPSGVLSR